VAIRVEPYTAQHERAVADFNRRLQAGGAEQRFQESAVPLWLPPGLHPALYNEMFVAVDDAGAVRGAYLLKHQQFVVAGKLESIANYAFPLSEGIVDRRYGMVGVTMILDAQKRNPLLFGLGMGGAAHPSVRVMKGVGWGVAAVPFLFRVVAPFAFLRNIAHLRRSFARALLLDAAAFTGAGWAGVTLLRLLARRPPLPEGVEVEIAAGFDGWADEIWASVEPKQGLIAVRDRAVLDALYPRGDRYIIVKVTAAGRPVGWAVCVDTRMRENAYFGNMRVGTIVDCLARPGQTDIVAAAADEVLTRRKVDVIISNQSGREWCASLRRRGYMAGPSNFALTCSRKLVERLGALEEALPLSHLNRGDGDGPINL
jgi:hypothetical protein